MSVSSLHQRIVRIATVAMLSALYFALSIPSVDLGFIKFTVASFAVLVAGFLFGPIDGALVGFIGAFLEQMVKYGFSVTMFLWIFPAVVRGLLIGFFALQMRKYFAKKKPEFTPAQSCAETILFTCLVAICAIISGIVVTLCNTLPLYVDFKVFGWSDENPLQWALIGTRLVSGIITSGILGFLAPLVIVPAARALESTRISYLWKKK